MQKDILERLLNTWTYKVGIHAQDNQIISMTTKLENMFQTTLGTTISDIPEINNSSKKQILFSASLGAFNDKLLSAIITFVELVSNVGPDTDLVGDITKIAGLFPGYFLINSENSRGRGQDLSQTNTELRQHKVCRT